MKKLSVVVPCYNEEETIPHFYKEIDKVSKELKDLTFEVIFVDDGSKDKTIDVIKDLVKKDNRIKYLVLSRNFGKEASMYAGLEKASGDFITIMDCDLQDPPSLLPKMYKYIIEEDYDQVGTLRKNRKGEPKVRSFFAHIFYRLINKMCDDIEFVDGARDYRLMKRCVVDAILSLKENERFTKGIFSFVGFKVKWIEYENVNRVAGSTKWSFKSLVKYAIDGILAFTTKPLQIPIYIGVTLLLFSFAMIIYMLCVWFNVDTLFTMLILIFMLFGLLFVFMGIIGLYLAKTYIESKNRPMYIIKEEN